MNKNIIPPPEFGSSRKKTTQIQKTQKELFLKRATTKILKFGNNLIYYYSIIQSINYVGN